ncbi:uncharacterized protein METZ01_LOCUS362623, partial [marine metagenome]
VSIALQITWNGPYAWPTFEGQTGLQSIPKLSGLYLQTFEYKSGYIIYAAGLTRRPVPARFKEHTQKYMNGEYNVLDVNAAQQGVRKEIWHGWGYAKKHRDEFDERKLEILDAVQKQLEGFRIFVGNVGEEPRILERLEASIMENLYRQPSPFCDIPDKGMFLSQRWDSEDPVFIESNCIVNIHGLPSRFEI